MNNDFIKGKTHSNTVNIVNNNIYIVSQNIPVISLIHIYGDEMLFYISILFN